MMYQYSEKNRLEEPHSYMYTPFQGVALLRSYQLNRLAVLHCSMHPKDAGGTELDQILVFHALPVLNILIESSSIEGGKKFRALMADVDMGTFEFREINEDNDLCRLGTELEKLTTREHVATLDLLYALNAAQIINAKYVDIKIWLDRLIQRFEVTKKLYEYYPPGFRKGEGANTSIHLYWLFALALCLYYAGSGNIKYLSTLLKVSDLLCSLAVNKLQKSIPKYGLLAVLATEIVSIQMLAEKKGVKYGVE